MATPDGVTLTNCAEEYGRRAIKIGLERRRVQDLQDAMNHAEFKERHHQLLDQLVREHRHNLQLIERPPFATIEVGTYKTIADLCQALTGSYFPITSGASYLMLRPKFTLLAEPAKLDLHMVSNTQLGHPNGCTVKESFTALKNIGAVKLPPEAGPQYRLQYADQPFGESRYMYMDPIVSLHGNREVFCVKRDDSDRWLDSRFAHPNFFLSSDVIWVYARNK